MNLQHWQLSMLVTATLSLLYGVVLQNVYSFVIACVGLCEYLLFVVISCCSFMWFGGVA